MREGEIDCYEMALNTAAFGNDNLKQLVGGEEAG